MYIPKFIIKKGKIYIDKETYNRDVMQVKDYKEDEIEEKDKEIDRLNKLVQKYDKELTHKTQQYEYLRHHDFSKEIEKIDKATNYYLKELSKRGSVNDVAVKMFNILEENIK